MITRREMIKAIDEKVEKCFQKAEEHFQRKFDRIPVRYNLKGAVAGQYSPIGASKTNPEPHFRFNIPLALENALDFITDTVTHEVSHRIQREIYGYTRFGKKVRSHGPEWRSIMLNVFGIEPLRCHSYDVSATKAKRKKQDRHPFSCSCRVHHVSTTIKNRIRKGRDYRCRICKSLLTECV